MYSTISGRLLSWYSLRSANWPCGQEGRAGASGGRSDGVVVLAAWMHGFGGAGRRCRVVLEAESCSFALDIYLDQHMQIQQAGRRTLCLSALGSNVSSVSAPLLLAARVSGVEPYFCGSSDKKRQWQGGSR